MVLTFSHQGKDPATEAVGTEDFLGRRSAADNLATMEI